MSALSIHVVHVEGPGEAVVEQLAAVGHTVSGPQPVADDAQALAASIRGAPGADVVVVLGACGPRGALPEAIASLGPRWVPGYGERLRALATELLDIAAIGLRAEAALVGDRLVFGLPAHDELAQRAVAQLLLPSLPILTSADTDPPQGAPLGLPAPAEAPAALPSTTAPPPTRGLSLGLRQDPPEPAPQAGQVPPGVRGWRGAVEALGAELHVGRREELPDALVKLAPVVNVLHTAGEFGTLRLPSGRRYGVYGWPDLRRDSAKVLAVSWGEPLAEVVALHRHPDRVGTVIDGDQGLLPSGDSALATTCEQVVGVVPPDPSGRLFAMDVDAVWILRERRVFKWDGRRERDDGSPKQVLASLALRWSNR